MSGDEGYNSSLRYSSFLVGYSIFFFPFFPWTFTVFYAILSNQVRKHQGAEYFFESYVCNSCAGPALNKPKGQPGLPSTRKLFFS